MYNLHSKQSVQHINQLLARLATTATAVLRYRYTGVPVNIHGTALRRGDIVSVNLLGRMSVNSKPLNPDETQMTLLKSNLTRLED